MDKITKIEQQKRNPKRCNIYINDIFAFGLDAEIIYTHSLRVGLEITPDFINEILKREDQIKANNYATNLISKYTKTEKELRNKMKEKGYEEDIINETVRLLVKYGYINDENYAKVYISDKHNFSKEGKNKIKLNLIRKGIDKDIIEKYLEENIDNDLEYKNALEIAIKKHNSIKNLDLNTKKRRLISLLQRKGFSFEIISKILKEIL